MAERDSEAKPISSALFLTTAVTDQEAPQARGCLEPLGARIALTIWVTPEHGPLEGTQMAFLPRELCQRRSRVQGDRQGVEGREEGGSRRLGGWRGLWPDRSRSHLPLHSH